MMMMMIIIFKVTIDFFCHIFALSFENLKKERDRERERWGLGGKGKNYHLKETTFDRIETYRFNLIHFQKC